MKEMNSIERFGDRLIELFHLVGLFLIGGDGQSTETL